MKRIAILRCLHSNDVCTGAACLAAFNAKSQSFEAYKDEGAELVAFWSCDGCKEMRFNNPHGLEEKIHRIETLHVDVLHLGVCTKNRHGEECPITTKIAEELEGKGIKIVRGTH
ncbi:MAG: CGGC domain-containing protein [Phascolarctobacterium sp.]|nr:CGGC domain-containing protein [Phascolarctobacterium sp.]